MPLTVPFHVAFLSQETLDLACEEFECFARFSEREKMANIRAEINEVHLASASVNKRSGSRTYK